MKGRDITPPFDEACPQASGDQRIGEGIKERNNLTCTLALLSQLLSYQYDRHLSFRPVVVYLIVGIRALKVIVNPVLKVYGGSHGLGVLVVKSLNFVGSPFESVSVVKLRVMV